MRSRAFLASLVLLSCAAAPSALAQQSQPASADEGDAASARNAYNAGTKAFADQRYGEAAIAFETAAAEKPNAIALFTAALSWDKTNAPERAADDYARALALPGLPPDKIAQAKERLASLESMLGAVAVAGPDGTRAQLDANTERPVPATLHGAAGVHTLMVRSPSGSIERRQIVVERGKTAQLDLATALPATQSPAPNATPAQPPPPETSSEATSPHAPRSDWKKPVGLTLMGVGGATLLAGVVLGLEAEDAKNAYDAAPVQATYDHAASLQTWTTVAFVAGGVLAAGGIALFLWPSHASHAGRAFDDDVTGVEDRIPRSRWPRRSGGLLMRMQAKRRLAALALLGSFVVAAGAVGCSLGLDKSKIGQVEIVEGGGATDGHRSRMLRRPRRATARPATTVWA